MKIFRARDYKVVTTDEAYFGMCSDVVITDSSTMDWEVTWLLVMRRYGMWCGGY